MKVTSVDELVDRLKKGKFRSKEIILASSEYLPLFCGSMMTHGLISDLDDW